MLHYLVITFNITALAERDLSEEEVVALRNHTLAVLHGNDPVLKLLHNRVRSFFRFACKYRPNATSSSSSSPVAAVIPDMRTGIYADKMRSHEVPSTLGGMKSMNEDFVLAASKEASRLGFSFIASDLINAANEARGIITLMCTNYGQDIIDRFMCAARRRDMST